MRRQESGGYCHGTAYSPCRAMLALKPAQSHLSEGVTFHMSREKREREGEGRRREEGGKEEGVREWWQGLGGV